MFFYIERLEKQFVVYEQKKIRGERRGIPEMLSSVRPVDNEHAWLKVDLWNE